MSRSMRDLGYGAHITLAVYDEMDGRAGQEAIASLIEDTAAIPLRCAGFGIFPGPPCCLWLVPVVTPRLADLQAGLIAALPTGHPHYSDGWIPHLTLADDLPDTAAAAAAVRLLGPAALPISGTLHRIDIVRFRPVEIVWSTALPKS